MWRRSRRSTQCGSGPYCVGSGLVRIAALFFGIAAGAVGLWMGLFAPAAAGLDLATMGTLPRLGLLIALFIVPMTSIAGAILVLTRLRLGAIVMLSGAVGWLLLGLATGNHVTPLIGGAILLSVIGAVVAFIADSGVLSATPPDPSVALRPRRAAAAAVARAPAMRAEEPATDDDEYFEPEPEPEPEPEYRVPTRRREQARPAVRQNPSRAAPPVRVGGRTEPVVDFVEDHSIGFRLDPTDPYGRPIGAAPVGAVRANRYARQEPEGAIGRKLASLLQTAFAVVFVAGLIGMLALDYARGPNSLLFAGYHDGGATTAVLPASTPASAPAPQGMGVPAAAPTSPTPELPAAETAPLPNLPQTGVTETAVPRLPPAPPGLPLLPMGAETPVVGAAPTLRQIEIGAPQGQPLSVAPANSASGESRSSDIPYPMPLPERLMRRTASSQAIPATNSVTASGSDPFSYCARVGTDHRPDPNAVQNGLPMALVQNLRQVRGAMAAPAKWRCAEGKVMVCIDLGNANCSVTPDAQAMLGFCRANPNTQNIAAPAGSWSCDGTRPVIPPGQVWPVDAFGFYPGAWAIAAPS